MTAWLTRHQEPLINWLIGLATLALLYVMATAWIDDPAVNDGLALRQGVLQVYEAGR